MAKKKDEFGIQSLADLRSFMDSSGKDFYKDPRGKREIIPSGFHTLDNLLVGGLRQGTYVELFGEESTGKTYLALNFMKSAQAMLDKPVCYMDFEKAWDPERAEFIGVNIDPEVCEVVEPPSQEEAYNYLNAAIRNDIFSVIVVDSVSGMSPEVETGEEMQKEQMGKAARVNSKGLRVITSGLKNTIVIFINQMREKIGVMFGDNKTTTGGKSLNYYAHMRVQCSKLVADKVDREEYSAKSGKLEKVQVAPGHIMKIKLVKSKMGNNDKTAQLVYDYSLEGVDRVEDLKSVLMQTGKLVKEGTQFYLIEGYDKIRGKVALYEFLRDNYDDVSKLTKEEKSEPRTESV